jgi:phosphatidylserine decarboxylase
MPLRGQLQETWYVPGRLFSVNSLTARFVPRLFARNERVVILFDTQAGAFALVMVGALHVGSMATVWAGDIAPAAARPGAARALERLPKTTLTLEKGAELGRFNMGSTVILLFQPKRTQWRMGLSSGMEVRLGETLGMLV